MEDRDISRAKRDDNGEWVEGFLFWVNDVPYILPRHNTGQPIYVGNLLSTTVEVQKDTICRCTGFEDKNGKQIFENDIMEAHLDDKFPEDISRTRVVWDKNAWVTSEPGAVDREYLDDFDAEHFYVVGNVFDNPKLLEV